MHEIQQRLRSQLEDLAQAGSFPVEAITEFAPRIDSDRESVRVARGFLEEGASQIPPDQQGALFIDIGSDASWERVEQEARNWFDCEGSAHPQLVGVLLISAAHIDRNTFEVIRPVWRATAPRALQDPSWCERLEEGLNHGHLRPSGSEEVLALLREAPVPWELAPAIEAPRERTGTELV